MTIDYVTLMLVNMVAGLVVAALFVLSLRKDLALRAERAAERAAERRWAAALLVAGVVAGVAGFHMALTWPLQALGGVDVRWANIAFGEPTVLLAGVLVGAGLAAWNGWSLTPVGVYSAVVGLAAAVIGAKILSTSGTDAQLTQAPLLAGTGFVLTGAGAILALPTVMTRSLALRIVTAVVLLAAAGVWALIGYAAYWMHVSRQFVQATGPL